MISSGLTQLQAITMAKQSLFLTFLRELEGMLLKNFAKLTRNHHICTPVAYRDKAQQFIWNILAKTSTKKKYQHLCDTKTHCGMKAVDWIDRIKMINEWFTLLDNEADKINKDEIVCKIIPHNIPKKWESDRILKDGGKAKNIESS